jgi:hypothetical protein
MEQQMVMYGIATMKSIISKSDNISHPLALLKSNVWNYY